MTDRDAALNAALREARELGYTAITTKSVKALLAAAAPFMHCASCDGHACPEAAS